MPSTDSRSSTSSGFLLARLALAGLLSGLWGALPWALLESILLLPGVRGIHEPAAVFAIVFLLYAVFALPLGLILGIAAFLLRGWTERTGGRDPVFAAVLLVLPAIFFGFGGILFLGFANSRFLPRAGDPMSLAADALILLIFGALFAACVLRLLRRGAIARPSMRGWGIALGLGGALLLLGSGAQLHRNRSLVANPLPVSTARSEGKTERPNLLVISIDTLRSDHVSAYGYERETTPFIDSLARDGILFMNSRSQSSVTRESTASLLTSLFPSSHGALLTSDSLPDEVTTLFEYLKDAEYQTGIFSGNRVVSALFNYGQGVDVFRDDSQRKVPELTLLYWTIVNLHFPYSILRWINDFGTPPGMTDRSMVDLWVVDRFRQWLGALNAGPFIAYIHLFGVHGPYLPSPPYDDAFGSLAGNAMSEVPPPNPGNVMSPGDRLPESVRDEMILRYDGLALFSDALVRSLMDMVRQKGMLDNTMVVITSDHGEAFWDHKMWAHGGSLYEEQVRVPLVLWAGSTLHESLDFPTGRKEVQVCTVDVMPTLLALANLPCPGCEGENLLELARRGTRTRPIYIEHSVEADFYLYTMIEENRKLIQTSTGLSDDKNWELYDLSADPLETHNLLPGAPSDATPLLKEIQARRRAAHSKRGQAAVQVDLKKHPGTYERLKALGYVN